MNLLKKSLILIFSVLFLMVSSSTLLSCDNGNQENSSNNGSYDNDVDFSDPVINIPEKDYPISSVDFAKSLKIGWNLGNTLDAPSETSWSAPKTTKEMIQAVHAAGFETIRIPVSWSRHIDDKSTYKINQEWLNRVKEVVDYAYNDGMYVIINIHHDNYEESNLSYSAGFALSNDTEIQNKSKKFISRVWKQIAITFAEYDEHLIFELLNEPRDINGKVWGNEWWLSGTSETQANKIITSYEQAGLDAIRSVNGNKNRFVMVPGYAASTSFLSSFKFPTDSAKDKLLLSAHAYSPYYFAMYDEKDKAKDFTDSHKSELNNLFRNLNNNFVKKGIGVVIGETGATNKNNLTAREDWFAYFFGKAYEYGMPSVLWDNMQSAPNENGGERYGYFNRKNCTWYFPTLIEKAMEAVGVQDVQTPEDVPVVVEEFKWKGDNNAVTVSSESLTTGWSHKEFSNTYFENAKKGSVIKFVCTSKNGGKIRLIYRDWTIAYTEGDLLNATLSGQDFIVPAGNVEVFYRLTEDDANDWKANGVCFVDPDLTVTAIYFQP